MIYGHELLLPYQLVYAIPKTTQYVSEYVRTKMSTLYEVHTKLRERQWLLCTQDDDEPLLFKQGGYVLLKRKSTKKGISNKLMSKYSGPYLVETSYPNHRYKISKHHKTSIQNEASLKLYIPDAHRQPNISPECNQTPEEMAYKYENRNNSWKSGVRRGTPRVSKIPNHLKDYVMKIDEGDNLSVTTITNQIIDWGVMCLVFHCRRCLTLRTNC